MQTPTNRRIEILEHAQSDPSNSVEQVAAYQSEIDAMQTYSSPSRESDPHALPDVEVFTMRTYDCYCENCDATFRAPRLDCPAGSPWAICPDCAHEVRAQDFLTPLGALWYWWTCFPGCMPDSEPTGPFATQAEAIADAQSNASNES